MKFFDFVLLAALFVLFFVGLYLLWDNLPQKQINLGSFASNYTNNIPLQSVQFYPEMRFPDRSISYFIHGGCSNEQKEDILRAFEIISDKTVLRFYPLAGNEPHINFYCSDVAPEPENKGHFIAGEGGPTEIINASTYSVILSSQVSLYKEEKCDDPQIALHEIFHALGFDHSSNKNSIMYPITSCSEEIDKTLIEDINRLYSADSLPDMSIISINASKSGRYLSFDIEIANYGLNKSTNSSLIVYADGKKAGEFSLGTLDIGIKKILNIGNVRVPRDSSSFRFEVYQADSIGELSSENNFVEMVVRQND